MADQPELKCFKPMTHRDDEKAADLFLVNKRGTLVPLCESCYVQFEATCRGLKAPDEGGAAPPQLHEEWLGKPEAERKMSLGDGMGEFLQQEAARTAGDREGPAMVGDAG